MDVPKPEHVAATGAGETLDENVVAELPRGCEIISVTPSGISQWVETVKIEVRLEDGAVTSFFKKGASGQVGYNMMKGSFEAEKALYEFIPQHVPRPLAYGTYKSRPDTHFYLCEFVAMRDDERVSERHWASAVASLHRESMGRSPAGQYGFPLDTHLANVPVANGWNRSWAAFWAQQMRSLLDREELLHGADDEFAALKRTFFERVVPRFLGALETGGRSIEPCLVHSDLWPGNIKPKMDGEGVCMFDSCAYWGHNEADLAICRNPRYRLGETYKSQYCQQIEISEPKEDFEARNAVYALKYHTLLSVMYHEKDKRFHQIAIDEMRKVVALVQDPSEGAMKMKAGTSDPVEVPRQIIWSGTPGIKC